MPVPLPTTTAESLYIYIYIYVYIYIYCTCMCINLNICIHVAHKTARIIAEHKSLLNTQIYPISHTMNNAKTYTIHIRLCFKSCLYCPFYLLYIGYISCAASWQMYWLYMVLLDWLPYRIAGDILTMSKVDNNIGAIHDVMCFASESQESSLYPTTSQINDFAYRILTAFRFEGILPKGFYLSHVSMAGRALLAGYPRI